MTDVSESLPDTSTCAFGERKPALFEARARVLTLGGGGGSIRLSKGGCIIGSGAGADLVVDDRSVSRAHVELALVPDGIAVRDLGSRNGTMYLGQRIERAVLEPGAILSLGATRIALEPCTEGADDAPYPHDFYRGMIGGSSAARRLFGVLSRLEGLSVNVLVGGESGTGKELVARALHEGSRRSGALVCVNCGAIARELITAELFGHKRGAFTGAVETREGAFEAAHSGTLFLDEIAELPLDVQPTLLRALESGEVRAVGSDRVVRVDVRIVAATHKDLEREVAAGRFREDLYFRLAVLKVSVPPLRDRRDDIPALARRFAAEVGLGELPASVNAELVRRPWPGNVRELRNVVQAYAALGALPASNAPVLGEMDPWLAKVIDVRRPYAELKDRLLEEFQRAYLEELLRKVNGNQTAAAKLAGMDRTHLGKLVARSRRTT